MTCSLTGVCWTQDWFCELLFFCPMFIECMYGRISSKANPSSLVLIMWWVSTGMILKYVIFRISFSLIRNYLVEELILLLLPCPELMLLVFILLTKKKLWVIDSCCFLFVIHTHMHAHTLEIEVAFIYAGWMKSFVFSFLNFCVYVCIQGACVCMVFRSWCQVSFSIALQFIIIFET